MLYSVGGDGWLVEWDIDNKDDGVLLARVPDQVFALAVSTSYILMGSFQGNFYIIDRENKSILHQERAHGGGIYSILADGELIFTFGGDGRIIQWNPITYAKTREIQLSAKSLRVQSLNPDKNRMAVGSSDGSIYILSYPELYLRHQIEDAHDPTVFAMIWMDDWLISGGRDALLKSWNVYSNYSPMHSVNAHWYAIYDLAKTPTFLISSSRDKTIRWWMRHSLEPVMTVKWGDIMEAHIHSVNSLAYDCRDEILYSGSEDRTIRGWRVNDSI